MRKPRLLQDGARYHVTARANKKEMILEAATMKDLFLSVVKRAKLKYRFRIENFCIMGNHFHFIIQPARGVSLSAIMRWIMGVFAMAYNRSNNCTGHVWGARFFSRIIHGLLEFMQVFRYIDANPVKSGQVTDPWDWQYGGFRHDREGCTGIIEKRPEWRMLIYPSHTPLMLQ